MSTSYAIAGVTAVLEYLLSNGDQFGVPRVVDHTGALVDTIAKAPDQIPLSDSMPANLNLFLHQISPNAAWRNRELPSHNAAGDRTLNQTLGLDLHYFVTAYGGTGLEAEALLGYAVQVFHEVPVLSREIIRSAMASLSLAGPLGDNLRVSGLADQIEQLKISPFPLSTEEMSRFWTALQAHYRPTFSFQVTVVLMKALTPAVSPLPVLTVNIGSQTGLVPAAPALTAVEPSFDPSGAQAGDTVTLQGAGLAGTPIPNVILTNDKFGTRRVLAATGATDIQAQFTVPSDLTVGTYLVALELNPGTADQVLTNGLPLMVVPNITSLPASVPSPGDQATVTVGCAPPVLESQSVSLVLGGIEVPAQPPAGSPPFTSFTFVADVSGLVRPVTLPVRLRVDGIDSFIVDRTADPPAFLAGKTIQVI